MHDTNTPPHETDPAASFWRRLLHRWLVEYNPLYLLSATLVLGGMILSSRGLAHEGSLYGQVGVAAIAELYAAALIGGAALLTRIGQRRPAVMLALLTVLYQCDLTLHTEACANLGGIGLWASAGWLALFVAKLYALAWATKLRLSRAAIATAVLGAAGMTVFPHLLDRVDPRGASALVALWIFALSAVQRFAVVTSLVDLDGWGRTVLGRAVRSTWLLWTSLLVLHVAFWSAHYRLDRVTIMLVVPLVAVRWIRSELHVWVVALATLVLVGMKPDAFSAVSLAAAAALGLRAWAARSAGEVTQATPPTTSTPYRAFAANVDVPQDESESPPAFVDGHAASRRFMVGALFAAYLSVWTIGWTHGAWPSHVAALDVALTVAVAASVWKLGTRISIAPLAIAYGHLVMQARLLPAPRTTLGWGAVSVTLGFLLLISSVGASYWLRRSGRPEEPRESS